MSSTRTVTNYVIRRRLGIGILIAGASLALASCGGSAAASGTISFAEGPGAAPNYIFPYMGCAYFSVANINQFQELMYRPLYWFGLGRSSAVQYPLSVASKPSFSDSNKTITIDLKGWKFSNGESVNARSVMFFLNLYKADPTAYCGYNQGFGIPDQVRSASANGDVVTINFTTSVNPGWILYNYLSEITPMPKAWDRTSLSNSPGSGGCATGTYGSATTTSACKAVETFLDHKASDTTTFADKLWQVVDGPWRLTQFDSIGNATFVPNANYSGPQKAQVAKVQLKSYTTTTAEESDLYANRLTIGFVDPTTLPGSAPRSGAVGPNLAALTSKYRLVTGTPWSFNYAPFNFARTNSKFAELRQLYIRQALQEAINQPQIIKSIDKGYGVPTCSPLPPNTPASIAGDVSCPYPYSRSGALALLTSHGWKMVGGTQTCVRAGTGPTECGAGISAGTKLTFSIVWASGSPSLDNTFSAEIAEWSSIGIKFSHSTATFNTVVADCSSGGSFQICSWGGGWIYAPDYYPSGETLFTPTGGFNPGQYSNSQMTSLIKDTTFGTTKLTAYAQYAAEQLPVLYQPNPTATGEISLKLKGVPAPDPLQNFMPEYMHY